MKDIVIFEDGKLSRGSRAKLIKRGNKRVLIEFFDYDYEKEEDVLVTEWFSLYIPSYARNKKLFKHKNTSYYHARTNEFYSDQKQTETFKAMARESLSEEGYNELWGEI